MSDAGELSALGAGRALEESEGLLARAEEVGRRLRSAGWKLALAESCTGGLVAHLVTEVPGSSEYFLFGAVTYSNEAKQMVLSVSAEDLIQYGAVSRQVARAMAEGVRALAVADCSVGITGIAGPGGGTKEKPVGTVYLAATGPWGILERHEVFSGSRSEVKKQAAAAALDMLLEGMSAKRE